jgi:hypothetical protein
VLEVTLPEALDDHQASIALKTNLLQFVAGQGERFCYLDSDVIAVRDDVDAIFDHLSGPVCFARDHVNLDTFSRWAVNCGCRQGACPHLREAASRTLSVEIPKGDWTHWNGGVFVFDERSREFLHAWHRIALKILADPYWKTRDQGALAAAVWSLGLQDLAPLPQRFNFIVDCMRGISVDRRPSASVKDFQVRHDYSLGAHSEYLQPRLIHFINGGIGRTGWRHWDDVRALLGQDG